MSKVMKQIPFGRLMDWALFEYAGSGSLFGVDKVFKTTPGKHLEIFGEKLELPFGPAAGPHTQVAQNIIAGWAAGARFFELKTVQLLDGEDLPVSKPCITAFDECYNVEWSTELYVPQAMDEYIKAWFALKLLSRELDLGDSEGFVFNMSVGYDLEGIKSKKIDDFIEGLRCAENTESWRICKQWAMDNLSRFSKLDEAFIDGINPEICRSITLSTLHGCPPEEIERIASYLLSVKNLNTFVKCNPTLLGYEYARKTLDDLGFDHVVFDDHHFKADLQYGDAVPMLGRLQKLADSLALSFGVKLSNTFPVQITEGELPGGEMYMSGRALFPLTIELVNRLSRDFGGKLRVSYSGGAEARNIGKLYDAGVWPVTLATTLLKPGGYKRMNQIAGILSECVFKPFDGVDCDKVRALVDEAASGQMYHKPVGIPPEHKISSSVPLIDCYIAPCRDGCPINQDVPAYLRLAGEGKHLEALRVITERNPLPFITGAICSQFCADKCTRAFYEGAVHIRDVKLEAAEQAYGSLMAELQGEREQRRVSKSGEKTAIIGGGPAGLSAAYFLTRAGRRVTIFEKRDRLGGIVAHAIPEFRIEGAAIDRDVELVKSMGAEVRLNCEVKSLDDLRREGFESVIVAVGAWAPGLRDIADTGNGAVVDALEFLERLKHEPRSVRPGENVVVIGGGNTAMDTARAAVRVNGVTHVSLVYRRTKRYMPADPEEFELALKDGVEFLELLAPMGLAGGTLTCEKMALGAPDASGRRRPTPTGETVQIPADTVIYAIGNRIDTEIFAALGIPTDKKGRARVGDAAETDLPGVFVIGDARRGPATVVEAIADAIKCAGAIAGVDTGRYTGLNINADIEAANNKKGILYGDCSSDCEPHRCLECATLCRSCADVCPNRANITAMVDGRQQIIHVDYMCNECGNCETFCPYSSAPYKDKFTVFDSADDFQRSENPGFVPLDNGKVRVRIDGETADHEDGQNLPGDIWTLIRATLDIPT